MKSPYMKTLKASKARNANERNSNLNNVKQRNQSNEMKLRSGDDTLGLTGNGNAGIGFVQVFI